MTTINIARDYSSVPAGRLTPEGPKTGELFRQQFLIPAFHQSGDVEVELDGVEGYGSSFLEEAFGGLIRNGISLEDISRRLRLITIDEDLKSEIEEYIAASAR